MPPDLPNYDPPSGPVPTPAATRFDPVSEPPVRSHLLPEAIPAIRSFTTRSTSTTTGSAQAPTAPPPANADFPAENPTAIVRPSEQPAADQTNSITLIPPDGTVILPLSHKSWRQRDASDGSSR
jgi:hypothetical protein